MAAVTSRLPVDFIDLADYHEAVDRLKLLNRAAGFRITIQRTKADKTALKQTRKVYIQCWRSRPYKSTSTGARMVTSKSTECPWRGALTKTEGGWRVEVMNEQHNHKLIDGASPPRTVKKRQQPKQALHATNEAVPHQTQDVAVPGAVASGGAHHTPSRVGTPRLSPAPVYPIFPAVVPENASVAPQVRSMTPLGEPPSGPTLQARPSSISQAASGRLRRRGNSIASEIRRVKVPMSQRLLSTGHSSFGVEPPAFLVYHDDFNAILGDYASLVLAYEYYLPFAHGTAIFSQQRDTIFVTSDQFVPAGGRGEKAIVISKLTRKLDRSWTRDTVRPYTARVNGGTNYGCDLLFCIQGENGDTGGLTHIEADAPYRTRVILSNYLGRRFNSINDVAVHNDGSIWFTDSRSEFEQNRPKPELPNQVYRLDPQTGDVRVVADGFKHPKGICFSQYGEVIYITDAGAALGDGSVDATRPATIYAFDVIERQNANWLTNRRVFAMPDTGVPHSIKCDLLGNVYAACGDGLNVWNAGGMLLGKVLIPNGITSFCFGKSGELFLCNGTRLWALTVAPTVKGAMLSGMDVQALQSMMEEDGLGGENMDKNGSMIHGSEANVMNGV